MSDIQRICRHIRLQLEKLPLHTSDLLLPGLSATEFEQLEERLPFILPDSAREMYLWSEGLSPSRGMGCEFLPGYGFESLSVSIEMYAVLSMAEDFPRFSNQNSRWFPMFHGGGTDFYGIICANSHNEDAPIVDDMSDDEPEVQFESLHAMLRTILAAYEQGVYYINARGQLAVGIERCDSDGRLMSVDLSEFRALAHRYNPTIPAWA